LIEVQDLTKTFGETTAVDHISFAVNKGEILGFLGPNGAGKTTTMRMLTSFMPATSGTARIAGFDVFDDSLEVRRHIGYLPENPPVYPDMTVEAYLDFVARIKGVPAEKRAQNVTDVLEKTNITDKRDELIKRLSRGYKQRVGLAQALVHDPDVIMTCDRVVIINKGKIAAVDTPQNLTSQLKGGQRIRVEVQASEQPLRELLTQIPGASHVQVEPAPTKGRILATIEAAEGKDIRSAIAARVVENGWPLYELKGVSLSLEDIFLELTTDDAAHAQQPGKSE
jgi:ABC-2 type transport system ATP-binding protein